MNLFTYERLYVSIYFGMRVYVYMYVCVYVCMYVCKQICNQVLIARNTLHPVSLRSTIKRTEITRFIIMNCKCVYTRWQCAIMQERTIQYRTVQYSSLQ